jgi:hypothetical protein
MSDYEDQEQEFVSHLEPIWLIGSGMGLMLQSNHLKDNLHARNIKANKKQMARMKVEGTQRCTYTKGFNSSKCIKNQNSQCDQIASDQSCFLRYVEI